MKSKNFSAVSIRIISYLSVFCAALVVYAAVSAKKAEKYSDLLEISRQRTFSQLCENLDAISTSLDKCRYSAAQSTLSELSDEMSASAAAAKLSLAELECGDTRTDGIYKFLSQVGAYTRAISNERYDYKKNSENLTMLGDYADKLYASVATLRDGYYDGTVSFEQAVSTLDLYTKNTDEILFSDGFEDAEQALTDYPVLIYDGPFSEMQEQDEAKAVKGLREITKDEARSIAAKLIEVEEGKLMDDGDEEGAVELYCFSSGERSVGITKYGGKLCYMLCSGYAAENTISTDEAVKRAKEYLNNIGYENMTESYFSVYDGICTVNFAYKQGETVIYSDLIKVGISLDTGDACTVDARGYLMNHIKRDIKEAKITPQQAQTRLNTSLRSSSPKLTLIPKNNNELYCYEFLCKDTRDNDALVYINALNGKEEQILLLLYSDDGTLTK